MGDIQRRKFSARGSSAVAASRRRVIRISDPDGDEEARRFSRRAGSQQDLEGQDQSETRLMP